MSKSESDMSQLKETFKPKKWHKTIQTFEC